jgi:hypothetical protein
MKAASRSAGSRARRASERDASQRHVRQFCFHGGSFASKAWLVMFYPHASDGDAAIPTSQLITLGIIVVILGVAMYRRMGPQAVRPNRLLITAGVIVLITVTSWATAPGIYKDPPALELAGRED